MPAGGAIRPVEDGGGVRPRETGGDARTPCGGAGPREPSSILAAGGPEEGARSTFAGFASELRCDPKVPDGPTEVRRMDTAGAAGQTGGDCRALADGRITRAADAETMRILVELRGEDAAAQLRCSLWQALLEKRSWSDWIPPHDRLEGPGEARRLAEMHCVLPSKVRTSADKYPFGPTTKLSSKTLASLKEHLLSRMLCWRMLTSAAWLLLFASWPKNSRSI